ncbi:hypothetical protein AB0M36_32560 [Actinoplanes sp. NPDC051346]|uniref:hypothetical protein n=1 Tax=Actinoplanes sp. NPDC051346 TaxID=3155048 RepID=UPI00341C80ED
MGLAINVGLASFDEDGVAQHRAALDRLSAALGAEGVGWSEPVGDAPPMRRHVGGFPYSCLRYLRRVLVLTDAGEPVPPADRADNLDRDWREIDERSSMLDSHLVCHSDSAGFFVPVDLDDPLFLPTEAGVEGGGIVGSSLALRDELRRCAAPLGIHLDGGELSDVEAERIFRLPTDAPFATESMVWLTLFEACRVSLASGHAIVFH